MLIHLLRHGIAEDHRPGLVDEDRALTEEGRRRLRRAASLWRELLSPPDRVLVSPLRRARETAEVFCTAVRFRDDPRIDHALVPGADPTRALALLEQENLAGVGEIALIGHEPHLGLLLAGLLVGDARQSIPLKKGMLVTVETEGSTQVTARLCFALTQKAAQRLT